jgi:hypothetical protein
MEKGEINTYISIITLNVNGVSSPIKRCTLVEWIIFKKLTSLIK